MTNKENRRRGFLAALPLAALLSLAPMPALAEEADDDGDGAVVSEDISMATLDDVKLAISMLGMDISTFDFSGALDPAATYALSFEVQEASRDGVFLIQEVGKCFRMQLGKMRGDKLDRAVVVSHVQASGDMAVGMAFRSVDGVTQPFVSLPLKRHGYVGGSKKGEEAQYVAMRIVQKPSVENKGTLRVPLFALASYRWDEEGAFYREPEPLIFGDCLYPKSILKNVQCDHAYVVSVLASKVRR